MLLKRNLLIYIIAIFVFFNFAFSTCSLAFSEDSIYVWSDFSSVSTSTIPTEEPATDSR